MNINTIYSYYLLIFTAGLLTVSGCSNLCTEKNNPQDPEQMAKQNNEMLFPKGELLPGQWFSQKAYLHPLLARDQNNEFALGVVTFEPGARTHWHTHPKGQVLIVTAGEGFYQEKGKPARRIKKGDVMNIPENVMHWHGASASAELVHIAITNYKGDQNVVWNEPVTDQQYNEVNN
ncbi:4-carboxymuconolactone decarboxylase [Arachidicoccus rhizosphaerae]|uniref:4-carboxymuconolactone decarboxylase n=1 Tax=Arachidicoccus rhizosphaerae TaxID=551991 RepID=A0A1H3VN92_9BACT|nr:cupin domain-containing protein [Arachidicoccus rhizosphaerae]SDZ76267.1 4-carboxymuconolactone decarboxylase [Arachidicoccus rhizosphaerae]